MENDDDPRLPPGLRQASGGHGAGRGGHGAGRGGRGGRGRVQKQEDPKEEELRESSSQGRGRGSRRRQRRGGRGSSGRVGNAVNRDHVQGTGPQEEAPVQGAETRNRQIQKPGSKSKKVRKAAANGSAVEASRSQEARGESMSMTEGATQNRRDRGKKGGRNLPENQSSRSTADNGKRRGKIGGNSSRREADNVNSGARHDRSDASRREYRTSSSSMSNGKNGHGKNYGRQQSNEFTPYPSHWSYSDCLALYAAKDPFIVRGKLRVLPAKDGKAFVTCDRGSFARDVLIATPLEQNRALDGDSVFVELYPEDADGGLKKVSDGVGKVQIQDVVQKEEEKEPVSTWQDDDIQRQLWNPVVVIAKPTDRSKQKTTGETQRSGRVVHVIRPKETAGTQPSELKPTDQSYLFRAPRRTVVGRMNRKRRKNARDIYFLTPNNKSLPQFVCPSDFRVSASDNEMGESLYKAEYVHGTWKESCPKPPCTNVHQMGKSCNVEDETLALLTEHNVNHGDFPAPVLKDVDGAVQSGMVMNSSSDMGWSPTPDMYSSRRDYREERIFTIDPTTAKDLDDALHVKELPDGRVEIGVHIADVSHFVRPGSAVDEEALRRATTVYLVDRTVPMLPRPLCEIACSLNENVERLAFSCVWRMNMDGTVENQGSKDGDEVWYGRTVIKSCARLDYATAQNIIEGKVATGEPAKDIDESLWPVSRRPSGKHTVDQVAADVRLMNRVAQARRRLRFQNGAIALNGIKLTFQLDSDGETPLLCAPYPIRDSNRLVEEFMLLANYFVAQRLITHAGGLALLRHHPPPLMDGIDKVVDVAKEGIGFEIDPSSSRSLQASLRRLGRECNDELVLQCVTEMLMSPMKPAEYMAAGGVEQEMWRHFALNIPYYTHFTSPIRRYADVIVHRLLQATLDGEEGLEEFSMDEADVQSVSTHCNEKRMASKKAQERSDRVFLALYLQKKPLHSQLGVVLSVGEKTFSVFVPSLGASFMLFLDEHRDMLTFEPYSSGDERRIRLERKTASASSGNSRWTSIDVRVFAKLSVSCHCKDKPPIDVKVKLEGPWR